jgi:hypothetical protein
LNQVQHQHPGVDLVAASNLAAHSAIEAKR